MGQSKKIVARQHKERYAPQAQKDFTNADLDNWQVLKNSNQLQMLLYKSGDLARMMVFFDSGGCFGQQIQQQIIDDDNIAVLTEFVKYWEFVPQMRIHMLRKASLSFVKAYITQRSLGRYDVDLVKNTRFTKSFIRDCFPYLSEKARRLAIEIRKI